MYKSKRNPTKYLEKILYFVILHCNTYVYIIKLFYGQKYEPLWVRVSWLRFFKGGESWHSFGLFYGQLWGLVHVENDRGGEKTTTCNDILKRNNWLRKRLEIASNKHFVRSILHHYLCCLPGALQFGTTFGMLCRSERGGGQPSCIHNCVDRQ